MVTTRLQQQQLRSLTSQVKYQIADINQFEYELVVLLDQIRKSLQKAQICLKDVVTLKDVDLATLHWLTEAQYKSRDAVALFNVAMRNRLLF